MAVFYMVGGVLVPVSLKVGSSSMAGPLLMDVSSSTVESWQVVGGGGLSAFEFWEIWKKFLQYFPVGSQTR